MNRYLPDKPTFSTYLRRHKRRKPKAKKTEISFCRELINEEQNADKVKIFSAAPYA